VLIYSITPLYVIFFFNYVAFQESGKHPFSDWNYVNHKKDSNLHIIHSIFSLMFMMKEKPCKKSKCNYNVSYRVFSRIWDDVTVSHLYPYSTLNFNSNTTGIRGGILCIQKQQEGRQHLRVSCWQTNMLMYTSIKYYERADKMATSSIHDQPQQQQQLLQPKGEQSNIFDSFCIILIIRSKLLILFMRYGCCYFDQYFCNLETWQ
jgi:hypothetical protein